MLKRAQLDLAGLVVLSVVFIFLLLCVQFFVPIMQNIIGTDPAYSSGSEKYLLYLIPFVMVCAGVVMFFIPNIVVNQR